VSAQPAIDGQGSFQVDTGTSAGELEIGQSPRLLQQIELQELVPSSNLDFHHSQTAAIHRDAVSQLRATSTDAGADTDLKGVCGWFEAFDKSGFFDNPSKHNPRARLS